jgi:hypothetical protein
VAKGEVVKFLGREAILAVQDTPVEVVEVPEWGGSVRVKTLSGAERDQFESAIVQRNGRNVKQNLLNIRARLVAAALVDENGAALFSFDDVEALGRKSARALDRIFGKAQELAGMREQDVEELANVFAGTPEGG